MSIDNDPMLEIRASFFVECEELLEALQDGLELIEKSEDDAETINVVFRAVHSIKGGAGAFGLERLVRFAHRYETVLEEVRSEQMTVTPELLKVFFQAADHLFDLVRSSRDGTALRHDETQALLAALDGLLDLSTPQDASAEDPLNDFEPIAVALDFDDVGLVEFDKDASQTGIADGQVHAYEISFTPTAALFDAGHEPAVLLRNLADLGDVDVTLCTDALPPFATLDPERPYLSWQVDMRTEALQEEVCALFDFVGDLCELRFSQVSPPSAVEKFETALPQMDKTDALPSVHAKPAEEVPKRAAAKVPMAARSVVRVDLEKIERLVNLVGELVINQAMISQSFDAYGISPHSDAMNGLEEFQRLTRDIQDSVMMIRAQPVKSLFQRMSRIVREASAAVDKTVRFVTVGESTEVDKTVIERLADPLTHMIRNAVDHGLEATENRVNAGKPAEGCVKLSAAHRSGRVIIEITDDGGGIDRTKVAQIATQKGLIPPDAILTDAEIDNLLFLPGFSTVSVVSDLSGRGVGMDVVRTEIQALGGRISIQSLPGEGTTFSISLPLTLAVLDGMVIEVADETLVLPLNLVIETLALSADDVEMVRPGRYVVRVRSGFVPIVDLGAALGYRDARRVFEDTVVLIISHEDGSQSALLVDNIVDQRQVVIKGLDEAFYRAPGIAAATILGDGQIALILDPLDIVGSVDAVHLPRAAPIITGVPA